MAILLGGLCANAWAQDEDEPAASPPKAAAGQEDEPSTEAPKTASGKEVVERWRFGISVLADGGHYRKIVATLAVPMDWPDQKVKIVGQEVSPGANITYQVIDGAVKQMTVRVPTLREGDRAKAIVTAEVRRWLPDAPADTLGFVLAEPKRLDRKMMPFLSPSPYIESNHPHIKAAAEKVLAEKEGAWNQVEALYDFVRKKVTFKDNRGEEVKGAVSAFHDGIGDCDEMTGLFVALCRAGGIPARTVRVPGHVFGEFYLLDAEGKGHWFPCQLAGTRAFGSMFDPRPILQKGDNLQVLDPASKRKVQQRFLPETLVGFPAGASSGSLKLEQVCERVKK
jgi:hypothetical protein